MRVNRLRWYVHSTSLVIFQTVSHKPLDGLRKQASSSYAWNQIHELRRLAPEIFSDQIERELKKEFLAWTYNQLTYDLEEIADTYELQKMRSAAKSWGVEIARDLYEHAYSAVSESEYSSSVEARDGEPEFELPRMTREAEDSAIHQLFLRLASDDTDD
jgi:hypothetical protein